jgi:hypothetical protein
VAAAVAGGGWFMLASTSGGATTPDEALGPPRFVEEAAAAGIDHVYDGEFTFFVGGGVAAFDCDNDDLTDLFFAGGTNQAALYRNTGTVAGPLAFTPVPGDATDLTGVTGAYPIDVDGDGITDLVVLRLGENVLLRGTGDCRFERANERWGVAGGAEWTAAFSATWEGNAALPTLAFGNYIQLEEDGGQFGGCSAHALVRPAPDGARYAPAAELAPGWCTLSILFSDWDRSGSPDLRMTNDRHYYRDGEEQLWRIEPGELPRLYTREEGWQKMQIWGMGIASLDLTGDGLPEVFLTSQADNKLQSLTDPAAGPSYRDIAIRTGVTAHRPFAGGDVLPSTAWHPEFQDVNNDGFIDLFITKGNVEVTPGFAEDDPNNLLLGGPEGTFVEAAGEAGILDFARSRGAALADFNGDGLLDLVYVNRRQNVKLWRNVGAGDADGPEAMGNWIGVRLQSPGPNRDAIGAWVEVRVGELTMRRELTIGGGHAGGQLGYLHFGLGRSPQADIRVQWPDGTFGPWRTVEANQFLTIDGAST